MTEVSVALYKFYKWVGERVLQEAYILKICNFSYFDFTD